MAPPTKPRLDLGAARRRAANAYGVDIDFVSDPKEHRWGWSFTIEDEREAVFVDAATGLVATNDGDPERTELLRELGPRGVPPWSPPPSQSFFARVTRRLRRLVL